MNIDSREVGTLLADMIFNGATSEEVEDVIRYSAAKTVFALSFFIRLVTEENLVYLRLWVF